MSLRKAQITQNRTFQTIRRRTLRTGPDDYDKQSDRTEFGVENLFAVFSSGLFSIPISKQRPQYEADSHLTYFTTGEMIFASSQRLLPSSYLRIVLTVVMYR